MATVKSLLPVFMDHNAPKAPFFVGWDHLLDKYFLDMPAGFTNNYFFEFEGGKIHGRRLATSTDEVAWTFVMCATPVITAKAILRDLFGSSKVQNAKLANVSLPVHKGVALKPNKILSLSKKYFSIPEEHLWYYPTTNAVDLARLVEPESKEGSEDEDVTVAQIQEAAHQRLKLKGAKRAESNLDVTINKIGRPKKVQKFDPKQNSILRFVKKNF
jgi:hypothetical protein